MKANRLDLFRSSRAGRFALLMTLARQLECIGKDITNYSMAKALNCSVYRARQAMDELCAHGNCTKVIKAHRKNVNKTVYKPVYEHLDNDAAKLITSLLIQLEERGI